MTARAPPPRVAAVLDAPGEACAMRTPLSSAAIRDLTSRHLERRHQPLPGQAGGPGRGVPGAQAGRLQIADIVVGRPVPEDAQAGIGLWTGWITGAFPEGEFRSLIEAAGFAAVAFSAHRCDTFSGAPSASSAASFDTQGVDVRARTPERQQRSGA